MERKIRVGAVDYLNTKPLIYGFENAVKETGIELILDYPANIASMLAKNEIDIGLVPVSILPDLKEYYIVSDYCIGTNGEVGSVCLFSEVEVNEIREIWLDYQSKTSVALLGILLREYWKIKPQLLEGKPGYELNIKNTTAGLIIGDRALQQRKRFKYIYDLGTAWKEMTGLPFVFAAWASNKEIDPVFLESFNNITGTGIRFIKEITEANPFPAYNLHDYYTRNINYKFDKDKQKALTLFLQLIEKDHN